MGGDAGDGVPDGTTMSAKGVETDRVGGSGLCLVTDFKADMMGMPFEGHGITTWESAKKKYIGSWADSMTPGMAHHRSDATTRLPRR